MITRHLDDEQAVIVALSGRRCVICWGGIPDRTSKHWVVRGMCGRCGDAQNRGNFCRWPNPGRSAAWRKYVRRRQSSWEGQLYGDVVR